MKASELIGPALDWAVAKSEGVKEILFAQTWDDGDHIIFYYARAEEVVISYSTDWAQGGPIIERERISVETTCMGAGFEWAARCDPLEAARYGEYGPTPLIAALRCHVASKLGDEIEIPEELQP